MKAKQAIKARFEHDDKGRRMAVAAMMIEVANRPAFDPDRANALSGSSRWTRDTDFAGLDGLGFFMTLCASTELGATRHRDDAPGAFHRENDVEMYVPSALRQTGKEPLL